MARIRSVHPGLFTDSDWVECSMDARLLVIGLWTLADDQGVFSWRTKEIKMAVFPGDSIDVEPLLNELVQNNLIRHYEVEGRKYGAIRNFRRWQRPQKPTAVHPLPESIAIYVGILRSDTRPVEDLPPANDAHSCTDTVPLQESPLSDEPHSDTSTVPVRDQYATATGIPIQRRGGVGEGGSRRGEEEVVRVSNETLTPRAREGFSKFCDLYPKPDKLLAAEPFWEAALSVAKPEVILAGLDRWLCEWRRRYGEEIRFIPSATEWLATKGWAVTPKPLSEGERPPAARQWQGPPEIRAAVVAAEGEAMAQNYLDPARWEPDRNRIITRTGIAAERLRKIPALSPYTVERHSEPEAA